MSRETEQQKIKTRFEFREELNAEPQAREFEHTILDPQQLREEVKAAQDSKESIRQIQAQFSGQTLPVQQVAGSVEKAKEQVEEPKQAPQESSWKERRAQKKQTEKERERGLKLTKYGDTLTARLVEQGQQYATIQPSEDLTELLRSMQSVTVSAEMFTDENFVEHYALLRDALDRAYYIALAAQNEQTMEEIRAQDLGLYATMLRWQQTEPMLRKMFRCASNAHGLDEYGQVLEEGDLVRAEEQDGVEVLDLNVVEHARSGFGEALDEFRDAMAEQERSREKELSGALESSYEEELKHLKLGTLLSSDENERQWVESPSVLHGSTESMREIQRIKTLIEENGERYLAHKDMLDQMYSDIIRRYEVLGELKVQTLAWNELQDRYAGYRDDRRSDGYRLWKAASDRLEALVRDSEDVADNLTAIHSAMTDFLRGETSGAKELAVLTRYGHDTAREMLCARTRREEWQNAEFNALIERGEFQIRNNDNIMERAATLLRRGDDEYNLNVLQTLQHFNVQMDLGARLKAEDVKPEHFGYVQHEDVELYRAYYEGLRRIVLPYIERIMAWDMERCLNMSDSELMAEQIELDELSGASALLMDLTEIHHPDRNRLSMKDDIVGDRFDEFNLRVATLQGLNDKSRGLALKMALEHGAREIPNEEYLTQAERELALPEIRRELGQNATEEEVMRAFAREQIEAGERKMQVERRRWEERRKIGSEAFKKACEGIFMRKPSNVSMIRREYPLSEAAWLYERNKSDAQPGATEEEINVIRVLSLQHYRIACWDEIDVRLYEREHGNPPSLFRKASVGLTLTEPIARTFNAYIATVGAQTQTPEQFHQMVRDLSAGMDLVQDESPEREIFEARERNRRGCLQFKESQRLTYDYLSRKYGFALETISALELYDHWEEIVRDFGHLQTDSNFIENIPYVIDMTNEEDRRLYNQINYMASLGVSVMASLQDAVAGVSEEERIATILERIQGNEYSRPARIALKRMGAASNMADHVTWGNEIRVGERREIPEENPQVVEERWQRFQGRLAARERERQELALQTAWRGRKVPYPNEYTEQLYQLRRQESDITSEKVRVVREVIEANIPVKKRPGKQVERAIAFMLPSFALNEAGKLWAEDEAELRRLATNYFCGNRRERNAVVNGIVNELCETEFSRDMFYPEYIREHYMEVKQLERRMNVMRFLEQDNEKLFKDLPYETHDLWDRIRDLFNYLSEWVIATLEISGLGSTPGNELFDPPIPEDERMENRQAQEEDIRNYIQQWQRARLDYLNARGDVLD